MSRRNLLILGRYLARHEHGIQKHFDMSTFYERLPSCGTIGCAAGFSLHAGICDTNGDLTAYRRDRSCIPERVTLQTLQSPMVDGVSGWASFTASQLTDDYDEDDWMFAGIWEKYDNTAIGAAKRIFWLLKYGTPITNDTGGYDEAVEQYSAMDIKEFMDHDLETVITRFNIKDEESQEFPSDVLDTID